MRKLVIGNSHAACLIEALRNGKSDQNDFSDLQLDFFLRAGAGMNELGLEGDKIFAKTSEARSFQRRLGQSEEYFLSDFDAIFVVGQELSIFRLIQIVTRNHVLDWNYDNLLDLPVITRSCLNDALGDSLDTTIAISILRMLAPVASTNGIKLTAIPQPYPSETILESGAKAVGFRRIAKAGIASLCRDLFEWTAAARVAAFGASFQSQPPSTVVDSVLTDRGFMLGSKRLYDLDKVQPPGDVLHANAAYGVLILEQIISTLKS